MSHTPAIGVSSKIIDCRRVTAGESFRIPARGGGFRSADTHHAEKQLIVEPGRGGRSPLRRSPANCTTKGAALPDQEARAAGRPRPGGCRVRPRDRHRGQPRPVARDRRRLDHGAQSAADRKLVKHGRGSCRCLIRTTWPTSRPRTFQASGWWCAATRSSPAGALACAKSYCRRPSVAWPKSPNACSAPHQVRDPTRDR
jgi:hypothetical protein